MQVSNRWIVTSEDAQEAMGNDFLWNYRLHTEILKVTSGRQLRILSAEDYREAVVNHADYLLNPDPVNPSLSLYHYSCTPVNLFRADTDIGQRFFAPIYFVPDAWDNGNIIPLPFLDDLYEENTSLWNSTWNTPKAMEALGLQWVPEAVKQPIVKVADWRSNLKRFTRYQKLVKDYQWYYASQDVVKEKVELYLPTMFKSWEQRNIKPFRRGHDMIWRRPHPGRILVVEVTHQDDTKALGMFTETRYNDNRPHELYWEGSYHPLVSHIGNNILLLGMEHAEREGFDYMNLGVGLYDWKKMWTDQTISLPGIRFTEGESYARSVAESALGKQWLCTSDTSKPLPALASNT